MGVTMGKAKGVTEVKKTPIQNFRKAAKVVSIMRKTSRDASSKGSDDDSGPDTIRRRSSSSTVTTESVREVEENGTSLARRESHALLLDDLRGGSSHKRESTPKKIVDDSRTVVFKDTTDAWAALREGLVTETAEIPETEFALVDSALTGYKTVERVHDVDDDEDDLTRRGRSESNESEIKIPYEPPGGFSLKIPSDEMCAICRSHSGGVLFPCRVCTHAFHEGCLKKSGRAQDATARQMLYRSTSGVGWSCHDCEDLSQLLPQDDMIELMEVFDMADIDSDSTISLEEFMRYRKKVFRDREDRDMMRYEEEDEKNQFTAIDTDRTGSLSWWEFLSHEAVRRLSSLSKKNLAKKLSEKEVHRARENFRAFDTDGDGVITEFEARRAFRSWYSLFVPDPSEMSLRDRRKISEDVWKAKNKEFNMHIDTNTNLLMSADEDCSGTISWQEYLLEQALFIIAARPNVGPIKLNRRPSFAQ
ncbi:PHD finger protein 24-like [Asterias rubens]|uniref:PHD finger protein 24-like n=1 Tax=Asterias rubens TaxID=7604 RepID=UPI0014554394|nr:PHD finger protein 24-like [Asterias rubens]